MELDIFKKYILGHFADIKILDGYWDINNFDGNIVKLTHWYNDYEKLLGCHNQYTADGITYEINEHGYRTTAIVNNKVADKTIACFGCSNTFGIGLPWAETWPAILQQNLSSEYIVKNYGVPGASNDMISRLIHNYLSYNKPDAICCYLPEISRAELYSDKAYKNFFPYDMGGIDSKFKLDKNDLKAFQQLYSVESCVYNFIKNFKFIEAMCMQHDVKLYWYTWSGYFLFLKPEVINKHLNIEKMITVFDNCQTNTLARCVEYYKMNAKKARDNLHIGKKMSMRLGEGFYKKILG